MRISVFGLGFLAALVCTLQLATAALSLDSFCKVPPISIICRLIPGNAGGSGSGNATQASTDATRSLPIIGSSPIGILPLR